MQVRRMQLKDLESVLEITQELTIKPDKKGLGYLVAPPSRESFIEALTSPDEILLVLEDNNTIVGYYVGTTRLYGMSDVLTEIMRQEQPFLYGKNVGIRVKHQGKGYAHKFYDYIFKQYPAVNYYEVNIVGNETAYRFKEKLGLVVYKEYYSINNELRYLFKSPTTTEADGVDIRRG